MNYRRALVVTELGEDTGPAFEALRRVAPALAQVIVVAHQPARQFAWFTSEAPPDLGDAASAAFDALREAAGRAAPDVEVRLVPELRLDSLADLAAVEQSELLVGGPLGLGAIQVLADLRKQLSLPVLWVPPSSGEPFGDHPPRRLLCVGLSRRDRTLVTSFLRDHSTADMRVTLLSRLSKAERAELPAVLEIAGIQAALTLPPSSGRAGQQVLDEARKSDLIVVARFPPALLMSRPGFAPVLILAPAWPVPRRPPGAIEGPDLVDDGVLVRVLLEQAAGVGRRRRIDDQEVAFVRGGRVVARATTRHGEVELPSGSLGDSAGVFRSKGRRSPDPLDSVEVNLAVLRPGPLPLVLFDAGLSQEELSAIRTIEGAELVGVRSRSLQSCRSLRTRLIKTGLGPRVIDAGAVLGEGDAIDVPEAMDAVRLARVASRMRASGFPVAAIVHGGQHAPATLGFDALRPGELARLRWRTPRPVALPASLDARLDATTGTEPIAGNRVEVELDNARARGWLLAAIAESRERVHLQVYMATDDEVGRQVEAALAEAAGRGVTVRVLVDSLHGLHGSFGARNALLDRLSAVEGIELRVSRPITGAPSMEDLKQRDHRKLTVVDGRLALIGGRNLAHEYYLGFDEVRLTAENTWREVPWLDAGAKVEGPAVAAIERSFQQAWTEAGGGDFEVWTPEPAGGISARVVVHRGLRDAYALEAYLAMIDSARSHIYAVNGFPLQLEIQHALVRAVRRGVRVRTLFGNFVPMYGEEAFEGRWTTAATAATWLVHSRMDPLVAAGGECHQFALEGVPGWDPALGLVRPHVHAKTVSADGRVCAVGSANLDITAGYWESELLLVIEDEAVTRALEARFDELIAGSVRVDPEDPEWQRLAGQREWMRRWPSVLSV